MFQGKSQSGIRKLNHQQQQKLVCCVVICLSVMTFLVIGQHRIKIPAISGVHCDVGEQNRQQLGLNNTICNYQYEILQLKTKDKQLYIVIHSSKIMLILSFLAVQLSLPEKYSIHCSLLFFLFSFLIKTIRCRLQERVYNNKLPITIHNTLFYSRNVLSNTVSIQFKPQIGFTFFFFIET